MEFRPFQVMRSLSPTLLEASFSPAVGNRQASYLSPQQFAQRSELRIAAKG
jgi:hypothetical protein